MSDESTELVVIEDYRDLLKQEFCRRYREWREAAESPLARSKVVQDAWEKYVQARESYLFKLRN